jgi:hypothetical protein
VIGEAEAEALPSGRRAGHLGGLGLAPGGGVGRAAEEHRGGAPAAVRLAPGVRATSRSTTWHWWSAVSVPSALPGAGAAAAARARRPRTAW